jgi:hypothetical protein
MPHRKRARCRGAPRASGWAALSRWSAALSTSVSIFGWGSASGSCCGPVRQWVQWRQGSARPFVEVGCERLHLAAVMGDERDGLRDPSRFGLLALVEPLGEPVEELAGRGRSGEQCVALAGVGGLQFDEALPLEVVERGDDPAALLAERGGGRVRVDARPEAAGPTGREEAAEELRARGVESGDDVVESARERPDAVAGVEGRPSLSKPASSR